MDRELTRFHHEVQDDETESNHNPWMGPGVKGTRARTQHTLTHQTQRIPSVPFDTCVPKPSQTQPNNYDIIMNTVPIITPQFNSPAKRDLAKTSARWPSKQRTLPVPLDERVPETAARTAHHASNVHGPREGLPLRRRQRRGQANLRQRVRCPSRGPPTVGEAAAGPPAMAGCVAIFRKPGHKKNRWWTLAMAAGSAWRAPWAAMMATATGYGYCGCSDIRHTCDQPTLR